MSTIDNLLSPATDPTIAADIQEPQPQALPVDAGRRRFLLTAAAAVVVAPIGIAALLESQENDGNTANSNGTMDTNLESPTVLADGLRTNIPEGLDPGVAEVARRIPERTLDENNQIVPNVRTWTVGNGETFSHGALGIDGVNYGTISGGLVAKTEDPNVVWDSFEPLIDALHATGYLVDQRTGIQLTPAQAETGLQPGMELTLPIVYLAGAE